MESCPTDRRAVPDGPSGFNGPSGRPDGPLTVPDGPSGLSERISYCFALCDSPWGPVHGFMKLTPGFMKLTPSFMKLAPREPSEFPRSLVSSQGA